jgi:hypothetical protein
MSSELRLQPDRLRSHAVTAAGLSEELRGLQPVVPPSAGPGRPTMAAEHERLQGAVLVAVRELAELSAAVAGAATAAVAADSVVARMLRHVEEGLGPAHGGERA